MLSLQHRNNPIPTMKTRKIKPAIIIYERLGVINMRCRPFRKKDANSPKQQLYRRRNAVMWQAYNTIKSQLPADILQRCKQKGIDMPQRLKVEITRQCLTPNANMTDWVIDYQKLENIRLALLRDSSE